MGKIKECLAERRLRTEIKKDLKLSKIDEAYHRKKMEYFKEKIIILNDTLKGISE